MSMSPEAQHPLEEDEQKELTSSLLRQLFSLPRGTLLQPMMVGKYELQAKVGQGGMGMVFQARDTFLAPPQLFALKFLLPKGDYEHFRREAKSILQLHHRNIVRFYNLDREGDLCFLVMEYVSGPTLSEEIRQRGVLPEALVMYYTAQIAAALDHALSKGIFHRDIKPQNILLTQEENERGEPIALAKVSDFGLAKILRNRDTDELTQSRVVKGTPHYLAPEVLKLGVKEADHRADIYSLGCTAFEALTGSKHFDVPLQSIRPTISEPAAKIVQSMLSPDPDRRYYAPYCIAQEIGKLKGFHDSPRS